MRSLYIWSGNVLHLNFVKLINKNDYYKYNILFWLSKIKWVIVNPKPIFLIGIKQKNITLWQLIWVTVFSYVLNLYRFIVSSSQNRDRLSPLAFSSWKLVIQPSFLIQQGEYFHYVKNMNNSLKRWTPNAFPHLELKFN